MKIAIIGAGPSGLSAARHCIDQNFTFDVFEQNSNLGGLWVYTDYTNLNEHGLRVHSSMYQNLRTRVPKELMEYEDFPYPKSMEQSYIGYDEVLHYIENYAEKFKIRPHIKFLRQVTKVEPQNSKWLIEIRNVRLGGTESKEYDAVMICTGHLTVGDIPTIPGLDTFKGRYIHSHSYRRAQDYQNKTVLIVGFGQSGGDICQYLIEVADKVYVSCKPGANISNIPVRAIYKPILQELKGYEAIFEDGSVETVDEIIFCTGYLFTFPFLSENCQIGVSGNYVHPLYKQIVNIHHPTMAFIGLPNLVCCFPEFDLQNRFFLATLSGHFRLPSKEEMLLDLQAEIQQKKDRPSKQFHTLAEGQEDYFNDVADTAHIKRVPAVISKLYMKVRVHRNLDDCYKILDDDHYQQIR